MKYDNTYYPDELYHHGIKGQKWGIRRFQKENGTMTSAGKRRYMNVNDGDSSVTRRVKKDYNEMNEYDFQRKYSTTKQVYAKRVAKYGDPYMNSPLAKVGKRLNNSNYGQKLAKEGPSKYTQKRINKVLSKKKDAAVKAKNKMSATREKYMNAMNTAKNKKVFYENYKKWDETIKNEIDMNLRLNRKKEANALQSKKVLMKIGVNQEATVEKMSVALANKHPELTNKLLDGYDFNVKANEKTGGVDFTIGKYTDTFYEDFFNKNN